MNYLLPCLAFVWIAYLWETYLQWRQRHVYKTSKNVPVEVEDILDQKTFDKSRVYQLDKSTYSLIHNFFKQLEFLLIIAVGGIPLAWNFSGAVIGRYGFSQDYEVLQSMVFILVMILYGAVTGLPWNIYYTFVLEEKHGFNKQTPLFFLKDQLKSLLLSSVLSMSIMAGLITIIKWGGDYFYIYAWIFVLIVSLVMVFIYHDFIAPCFDKYTPLPEGNLRTAIEGLASSLSFPLKKLLVVEGSKRSAHSNAYLYGFWKNKCIVLFDTLVEDSVLKQDTPAADDNADNSADESVATPPIDKAALVEEEDIATPLIDDVTISSAEGVATKNSVKLDAGDADEKEDVPEKKKTKGCNTAEILGVLAHELGHWKLSHNIKNLVIGELNLLITLFLFGYFMNQQDMFASFGFPDTRPILIGLILFLQLIFLPYNEVFSFMMTQLVRRFEYQADAFAVGLGHAGPLGSALSKLNKDNLSFPIADPLYSAFHHSHPTLLERLRALKTSKKTD